MLYKGEELLCISFDKNKKEILWKLKRKVCGRQQAPFQECKTFPIWQSLRRRKNVFNNLRWSWIYFNNFDFGLNTKKDLDHIVCSYGYKIIYVDERYSKAYKTFSAEESIKKIFSDLIKKCGYCLKVTETE